ncbi:hypothetical protein AB0I84_22680 [Streptomyces spectabilis]|uniref:hypothetical protein n=1 Tax=Streptomyces spectabilis TaxID=68270 RepID=UPI0033C7E866
MHHPSSVRLGRSLGQPKPRGFVRFGRGPGEYAQAVKVKKGQTPYWSDRQRIEWARWTLPTILCESTNTNKVCDPNA